MPFNRRWSSRTSGVGFVDLDELPSSSDEIEIAAGLELNAATSVRAISAVCASSRHGAR